FDMQKQYASQFPSLPATETLYTSNINDTIVKDFILRVKPDLVVVSGTSLLRKNILEVDVNMINLHTGLSPYVKGAPNCTNWCISTGDFHLIGNTIMWIDAGIDSGDIIATSLVPLIGSESLSEVHVKVMEHAHTLYIDAIESLVMGIYNRVKQDSIASGKTYYSKDWNMAAKRKLLLNFKRMKSYINSERYLTQQKDLVLINPLQGYKQLSEDGR
ncbi:MAG: hypothetical protein EOP48_20040, partial [Sphingobacteriales bacterium]